MLQTRSSQGGGGKECGLGGGRSDKEKEGKQLTRPFFARALDPGESLLAPNFPRGRAKPTLLHVMTTITTYPLSSFAYALVLRLLVRVHASSVQRTLSLCSSSHTHLLTPLFVCSPVPLLYETTSTRSKYPSHPPHASSAW